MNRLFAIVLALFCVISFSADEVQERPTYKADESHIGQYETGFVPRQLSAEQAKAKIEFEAESKKEGWTFDYDVNQIGKFETGYTPGTFGAGLKEEHRFQLSADPMKSWDISDFKIALSPTMNQGSCGSCVIFSFTLNFTNSLLLRGFELPDGGLSQQQLMNCGTGGQCSGADGEGVGSDLVKLGGLVSASDYPYTARTGRCQSVKGKMFGQIESYETIPGTPEAILTALRAGQPVSAGVAVDGRWQSYTSGVYNGCSSMRTNHYIDIEAVDCGTSVDADGNCVFNSKGMLPPGVGTYKVHNSWGKRWGQDGGYMITQITSKRGQLCNNIGGGGVQILNIGVPMKPKEPVTFTMDSAQLSLTVTIQPEAKYTVDQAKAMLQVALDQVAK